MKPVYCLFAAAFLLVAPTLPTHAAWEGTEWGMSPDEALAVLAGARAYSPDASELFQYDGLSYDPLVKLDHQVGSVAGESALLFDGDQQLHFVMFIPQDIATCDDLTTALVEAHGAAEESGFGSTAIFNWVDNDTVIRLTNSADIGICNLSYGAS